MENLTRMSDTGMFLNDLSMHDSSRDLVLAGTQQQAELKMALDQVRIHLNWHQLSAGPVLAGTGPALTRCQIIIVFIHIPICTTTTFDSLPYTLVKNEKLCLHINTIFPYLII